MNANILSSDPDIKISNNNGDCISSTSPVYWNYGILSSTNLKFKCGYSEGTPIQTANSLNRYPCIYYDKNLGEYKTQLSNNLWSWEDEDSGSLRTYTSNNLQNVVDILNLAEKNIDIIVKRNKQFGNSLENNNAQINKKVTIDFNSDSRNYINVSNSKLTILSNVIIKNYYANTNSNITIGNNSTEGNLTINLSNINNLMNDSSASGYAINNTKGVYYQSYYTRISGTSGIYCGSGTISDIYGEIDTTKRAIWGKDYKSINLIFAKINSSISGSGKTAAIYLASKNADSKCNICGSSISCSAARTIYNEGGILNIFNNATLKGKYGIESSKGNVTIAANYNENSDTFSNFESTNIGPTIESIGEYKDDFAIFVNDGILTLGNKEENAQSLNMNVPIVKAVNKGIKIDNTGKLNFYDGKIYSFNNNAIEAPNLLNQTKDSQYVELPTNNYSLEYSAYETGINEKDYVCQAVSPKEKSSDGLSSTIDSLVGDRAYIKSFKKASAKPNSSVSYKTLAINSEQVYFWFNTSDGTLYYWNVSPKLALITGLNNLFASCTNLTSVDLSNIDISGATSMTSMFYGCSKLTEIKGLTDLNTSKITNTRSMFNGCSSLKKIDLTNFDTSKVTDMSHMFRGCKSLTSIVKLENLDTSNVTNMSTMFYGCTSLSNINLTGFNTSKVTDMSWMFHSCKELSSLNVSQFDTSNVTNMYSMFGNCIKLKTLDLSRFNTLKVTNADYMFGSDYNTMALQNITVGNNWNIDVSKNNIMKNCNAQIITK